MNSDTYRQLEAIFSKFNESIVDFYSSLLDLFPEGKKLLILEALKLTLQNTGVVYRLVSQKLFEATKE